MDNWNARQIISRGTELRSLLFSHRHEWTTERKIPKREELLEHYRKEAVRCGIAAHPCDLSAWEAEAEEELPEAQDQSRLRPKF